MHPFENTDISDVTLAYDDQRIKAQKVILLACSLCIQIIQMASSQSPWSNYSESCSSPLLTEADQEAHDVDDEGQANEEDYNVTLLLKYLFWRDIYPSHGPVSQLMVEIENLRLFAGVVVAKRDVRGGSL